MAVLIYSSGRIASFIVAASPGRKLPMNSPTSKAIMNPDSLVRFSDQPIFNPARWLGVAAMKAQLPINQQA